MALFSLSNVQIAGVAAAVPANREDNSTLPNLSEKSKQELMEGTGIRYRHVAPTGTCASDLCFAAAQKLLGALNWRPEEIDVLIVVSQTPDHLLPASATQLQHRLGMRTQSMVLDLNHGCAGYVYGLSTIGAMLSAAGLKKGLLLVGDTITRTISPNDLSLKPIFADAGSATALKLNTAVPDMHFLLGSNGADYQSIYIPHGGARNPTTPASYTEEVISNSISRSPAHLSMKGHDVFTFGLTHVAKNIQALLQQTATGAEELDYLFLHQANKLLLEAIRKKVGIELTKVPSSLHDFGNTSCATIPVTMVSQQSQSLSNAKNKLVLSGFGVGLSWGSVILDTEHIVCPEMIIV